MHGRAFPIRILLDYFGVDYEDSRISRPDFFVNKKAGKYTFGQVPVLFTEDGKQLTQRWAIMRYLSQKYRGPNEEDLYNPISDPETAYLIDRLICEQEELVPKVVPFLIPYHPMYKNKDAAFLEFICNIFPAYLQKIEKLLKEHKGPYLLGSKITLADFVTSHLFFWIPRNPAYENSDIVAACMANFPLTKVWVDKMQKVCEKSLLKNKSAF